MQKQLTFDELHALIGQAKIIYEDEDLYLSPRQEEWLFDIIEWHVKQRHWKVSDRAVEFLLDVVSGKYKEPRWIDC